MAFSGSVPLADLTRLVESMRSDVLQRDLRAAQRKALIQWRDTAARPGLRYRFTRDAHTAYGFANRTARYLGRYAADHGKDAAGTFIRKGALPDYVYTGRFRDSLVARKPKKGKGATIATTFSVYGGALNLIGHQRGVTREESSRQTRTVQRQAHTRTGRNGGAPVQVRAYNQRTTQITYSRTPSARTYGQEWAIRPEEIAWVQVRSDAIFLEIFKKTRLKKDGTLTNGARADFRAQAEAA